MPKPRAISPEEARRTLAAKIGKRNGLADRVRQLATKFGVRPTRLWMVHVLWTGEERGAGHEREISRVEILPTPRIKSLDSLALSPFAAGVLPLGSIQADRISASYTMDELTGRVVRQPDGTYAVPGPHRDGASADHIGSRVEFYFESQEDGRGDDPAYRMRFRVFSTPMRRAGQVDWTVRLERAGQDHLRDGTSAMGQGTR